MGSSVAAGVRLTKRPGYTNSCVFFDLHDFSQPQIAAFLPVLGWSGRAFGQDLATNPVADQAARDASDKTALNFDKAHGYLRSVLKEPNVPISSQTLVFSKSSFQPFGLGLSSIF